jgi:putative phosphoribosyl transferase
VSVEVAVTAADAVLAARLTVPRRPLGVVLVPTAGGVVPDALATALLGSHFAVLGADLHRYGSAHPCGISAADVSRLTGRLITVTRWAQSSRQIAGLSIGFFGTGVAAAVALRAAAELDGEVAAVVSSQGRPDLVRSDVTSVTAATLLIVGGADPVALDRNGSVEPLLRCPSALEIVSGATRRFVEPGAMDRVVELAVDWFRRFLAAGSSRSPGACGEGT